MILPLSAFTCSTVQARLLEPPPRGGQLVVAEGADGKLDDPRLFKMGILVPDEQEQSPSNATSLAMMQEPQEVVEETVTIEEDPGTPSSHVSVVTSDDGTTRRTETKM
ncbi:Armadillo repeat protein deleted in velo-cardio-facial syndrome [Liparis tanakae]|uniref:Armadillo repeat protein deleted in velo-cardio-facial syndrome n=1 Tax=Liparis tanakae TaxID=230148 RepID=A0A4Z2IEL5_9TELE|nr:Armadillo repeat protein deleted in velo-cardio-facial syndrome [Liparis tanakae]